MLRQRLASRAVSPRPEGRRPLKTATMNSYSIFLSHSDSRIVSKKILVRRPGDVAECYADPTLSHRVLSWRAERGLERICEDAWRWQRSLR